MIFRRKPAESAAVNESTAYTPAPGEGKGHATPSRKESRAARHRPLVVQDRKAAKTAERLARMEQQAKVTRAMQTGDEKYLPQWDKGPARRFARDYVDARFSLGEWFIPVAMLIMIMMLFTASYPEVAMSMTLGLYIFVFIGLFDGIIMSVLLMRLMKRYFAEGEIPKGTGFYAFRRVFILRRFRTPRPQVARGEWPQNKLTPRY